MIKYIGLWNVDLNRVKYFGLWGQNADKTLWCLSVHVFCSVKLRSSNEKQNSYFISAIVR